MLMYKSFTHSSNDLFLNQLTSYDKNIECICKTFAHK